MNIIVNNLDGIYCRPDTSWERENNDLYSPDYIKSWSYSPVVFARISKAGKCIGRKFVDRYYDSIGFGMLLYGSECIDGAINSIATTSCLDHSSLLPMPLYNPIVLEGNNNYFVLSKDGNEIFSININPSIEGNKASTEGNKASIEGNEVPNKIKEGIEKSICAASAKISLRIGDIVALELARPNILTNESCSVSATFCKNDIMDFKIIL